MQGGWGVVCAGRVWCGVCREGRVWCVCREGGGGTENNIDMTSSIQRTKEYNYNEKQQMFPLYEITH